MNGMIILLGDASKIPNEIARIIYAISSKDGTELKEAEKVAAFVNSYKINLKCSLFKGKAVTLTGLNKILADGGVGVADVCAGTHSVLVTGYSNGKYKIFDPDWKKIKHGRRKSRRPGELPKADFNNFGHDYNVIVTEQELFAERSTVSGKLRMGAISKRCLFVMEHI